MNYNQENIDSVFIRYFDIVDSYFRSIKHYLGKEEDSHIDLGIKIANYPLISDLILDAIDDLGIEIENFWKDNATIVFDFIKKQDTLNCLYSGDITPLILENFVKKSALYIDTVILPDPIFNLALFQKQIVIDRKYYLNKLIRHVFNIWKLKELVLANTKEKIILLLPINIHIINTNDRNQLLQAADKKFTTYIDKTFNQSFEGKQSCLDFLSQYKTSKDIFSNIKNYDLLPNIFKQFDTFHNFLINFSDTGKFTEFNTKSVGWNFGLYLHSQFIRVQEHKFFCDKLIAEPIYDYELPWFFFNYEIGGLDMDTSIANALQREKFDWISNIPITALKILREENKLNYMRNIIRNGITDLKAKYDKELLKISEQIEKNFREAFEKQKSELKFLEKKVKEITNKEIPITTGGFLAGLIPYLSIPISIVSAGKDIYKLLKKRKIAKKEIIKKENDFINLLMKSYERK